MSFIEQEELPLLARIDPAVPLTDQVALQTLVEKFNHLHRNLYLLMKNHNFDLYNNHAQSQHVVGHQSVSTRQATACFVLNYYRSPSPAMAVERLIGMENATITNVIQPAFHPNIEIRLDQEHFAVELIVPRTAWWDQENFKGKLSLGRYLVEFHHYLRRLPPDFILGFWEGIQLDSQHLSTEAFQHFQVFQEIIETFDAGKDYFRLGFWYPVDTEALTEQNHVDQIFFIVKQLYPIYEQLLWSSDNNFRAFLDQG